MKEKKEGSIGVDESKYLIKIINKSKRIKKKFSYYNVKFWLKCF